MKPWKVAIVVIVVVPSAFGIFNALLAPLIIAGGFIRDWFVHDAVIATVNVEMAAFEAQRPLPSFLLGYVFGLFISCAAWAGEKWNSRS